MLRWNWSRDRYNHLSRAISCDILSDMNTELAFRLGFCERLASRGVAPDEVSAALDSVSTDKSAGSLPWGAFGREAGSGYAKLFKSIGSVGFFGPAILAGLAGYLFTRSRRVSDADLKAKKDIMVAKELEEQRRMLAERRAGVQV